MQANAYKRIDKKVGRAAGEWQGEKQSKSNEV